MWWQCINFVTYDWFTNLLRSFISLTTPWSFWKRNSFTNFVLFMILEAMIAAMGFRNCLLTCAAILLTNVVIGIIFTYKPSSIAVDTSEKADEEEKDTRKISLKVQGTCACMFSKSSPVNKYLVKHNPYCAGKNGSYEISIIRFTNWKKNCSPQSKQLQLCPLGLEWVRNIKTGSD